MTSETVDPSIINDVRIASGLNQTIKIHLGYPSMIFSRLSRRSLEQIEEKGVKIADSHTRERVTVESEEMDQITQICKMRTSLKFCIEQIAKDKLFVFEGVSMTIPTGSVSLLGYFDKELFGKRNLCIDGMNIGSRMKDTNARYKYIPTKDHHFYEFFFDTSQDSNNNPLTDIESFEMSNRRQVVKNQNTYGITYNVACKLIDILNNAPEELKFDNYVITLHRHSILDFFWSLNKTQHNSENIYRNLQNIGSLRPGLSTGPINPDPICIKYSHKNKNIYFVSLPIATVTRTGIQGTESDDYLCLLLGLRYRTKFLSTDKFKWITGVLCKRLFTETGRYDYYDKTIYDNNNLIEYYVDNGRPTEYFMMKKLVGPFIHFVLTGRNTKMYYPPIPPGVWMPTIPTDCVVPRDKPQTVEQIYRYNNLTDAEQRFLARVKGEILGPSRKAQTVFDLCQRKITTLSNPSFVNNDEITKLIGELERDSEEFARILDDIEYNHYFKLL
jgi:hypothetical protein